MQKVQYLQQKEIKACGRLSFSKIGATCLAKICASKVENKGIIELEKLEQPIEIDDSIEQYMLEIENNLESITNVFRANEKINSNNTLVSK